MLILADTSIWIDALRGKTPEIVSRMQVLINEDSIATCGPVLGSLLKINPLVITDLGEYY